MIRKLILYGIFFSVLLGCKKVNIDDPIVQTAPIFKVHGLFGENLMDIVAGEQNGLMQTEDSLVNGVTCYKGVLGDDNTTFELQVMDGDIDNQSISFYQKLPNDLPFGLEAKQSIVVLSKNIFSNKQYIQQIIWNINGSMAGIDNAFISNPGRYLIEALVTFTNGSNAKLANELIIGYRKESFGHIQHFLNEDGYLKVWINEEFEDITNIKWYLDDEYISSQHECFALIDNSFHTVSVEVKFKSGAKIKKSILVHGTNSHTFLDDFSIFESPLEKQKSDYLTKLKLTKDGKTYATFITPNSNSKFHILDRNYYGKAPSGKDVYALTAEVDCLFRNISCNEVIPFSGLVTLGIQSP